MWYSVFETGYKPQVSTADAEEEADKIVKRMAQSGMTVGTEYGPLFGRKIPWNRGSERKGGSGAGYSTEDRLICESTNIAAVEADIAAFQQQAAQAEDELRRIAADSLPDDDSDIAYDDLRLICESTNIAAVEADIAAFQQQAAKAEDELRRIAADNIQDDDSDIACDDLRLICESTDTAAVEADTTDDWPDDILDGHEFLASNEVSGNGTPPTMDPDLYEEVKAEQQRYRQERANEIMR